MNATRTDPGIQGVANPDEALHVREPNAAHHRAYSHVLRSDTAREQPRESPWSMGSRLTEPSTRLSTVKFGTCVVHRRDGDRRSRNLVAPRG